MREIVETGTYSFTYVSGPLGIRTPDPWIKSLTSSCSLPREVHRTPVLYLAELEALEYLFSVSALILICLRGLPEYLVR